MILVARPLSPHSMHTTETAMATLEVISLMGCSGRSYAFTVNPIGAPLAAMGAVYAVLRDGSLENCWTRRSVLGTCHHPRPSGSRWTVLYIGQTENISARFANARRDLELARIRATHCAVLGAEGESWRRSLEFDLVQRYAALLPQAPLTQRKPLVESLTIAQRSA
jgi:hypothetical protein